VFWAICKSAFLKYVGYLCDGGGIYVKVAYFFTFVASVVFVCISIFVYPYKRCVTCWGNPLFCATLSVIFSSDCLRCCVRSIASTYVGSVT
jgi:hypothetical protein